MSTKKLQLVGNIPKNADDVGAVSYDVAQTLTDEQKIQARENISAQNEIVNVEILETICENIELTKDNNSYTFPEAITLDENGLYYLGYKMFNISDGSLQGSASMLSSVIKEDANTYVRWLSTDPDSSITMITTGITDTNVSTNDKNIITIYKIKCNIVDSLRFYAINTEGIENISSGMASHAEGGLVHALGLVSHAEGYITTATGMASHSEGANTKAIGDYSHAEGYQTTVNGPASHSEGYQTTVNGSMGSHAEGYSTTVNGMASHSEGANTKAIGDYSHAEGSGTEASGSASHSEGANTKAIGDYSHAEGLGTEASGSGSHAEGILTAATGDYSHAEGSGTKASSENQHAQGKYNIEDTADTYAHIVGNGTSDTARSNAHTLDWSGNAWFAGDVYVGGTGKDDEAATKLQKAAKSVAINLTSSAWDSTAKTQTATVSGVLADETKQLITPTPALASQTAYYEAGILCTGQAADSLTFTATKVPTSDLTVYVVIQEVTSV